jgi:hypothetical protein
MRLKLLGAAAFAAALVAVVLPGAALSIARVDDTQSASLSDFDSRAGKIAPTKAQRALAAKLKVRVSWNRFGTPGSVSKRGTFPGEGNPGHDRGRRGQEVPGSERSAVRASLRRRPRLRQCEPPDGKPRLHRQLPSGLRRPRDVGERPGHDRRHRLEGARLEGRLCVVVLDARPCSRRQGELHGLAGLGGGSEPVGSPQEAAAGSRQQGGAGLDAARRARALGTAAGADGGVPDAPRRRRAGVRGARPRTEGAARIPRLRRRGQRQAARPLQPRRLLRERRQGREAAVPAVRRDELLQR